MLVAYCGELFRYVNIFCHIIIFYVLYESAPLSCDVPDPIAHLFLTQSVQLQPQLLNLYMQIRGPWINLHPKLCLRMKQKMAMSGKELFSMHGSRGVDAAGE